MMEPEIPMEQINAMMSSEALTDHHVKFYLFTITGYLYDVAQAAALNSKPMDHTEQPLPIG